MARKEHTTKVLGGYKTTLIGPGGKKAEGYGSTKEESIKKAYKHWREKYGEV